MPGWDSFHQQYHATSQSQEGLVNSQSSRLRDLDISENNISEVEAKGCAMRMPCMSTLGDDYNRRVSTHTSGLISIQSSGKN